ncbi:RAMP superfamily CRISPR-associated protein [Azotobacter vinelandii]|uniref:RAMP superfamily CRISPR-associated protein n=1 Tax=Azotobacter vinelandii TaxID=354 RepID=UPI0026657D8A|nr:RAMP superfamily CRISPR-associated protein [Azotobacter vinelandii]WKN24021.1 hypothetical protein AVAEIV_002159 [Azotobacter vinelandii]
MLQATFDIHLEQPLIVSQQAASAGAHQSLDYIPGSILLGVAASRLYAELDSASAWTLFHSGQVRFGDALPSANGETGHPVPLCWHTYKGESAQENGRLHADRLFDPSHNPTDETRQPVQIRAGYVTRSGFLLQPQRQQTLKTAIDRQTGMAAESQLFGYEALATGQRFRFELNADADLDPALWQRLQKALEGTAHLGRSRSAQFGQARIERQTTTTPRPGYLAGDSLTLWLLSDLLLEDRGQPCLIPHPHLLGLPEGSQWLAGKSFLRSRRYSPYNTYRRHYDSERQVICRGSVLRYQLPHPLSTEENQALRHGLGLCIESGLGDAWIDPPLLAAAQPRFAASPAPAGETQRRIDVPDTPLIAALQARRNRRLGDRKPEEQARKLFAGLCQRVREARRYAAIAINVTIPAPGRSQWGLLKQLASDHRNDPAALWKALTDTSDGVIRDRSGWELRYGPGPEQRLDQWMRTELEKLRTHTDFDLGRLIGHLAVLGLQQAWVACCNGTEPEDSAA